MDFAKMKVADLKRELKNRGLSVSGNKNELQDRLQLATLESDAVLDPNISKLLDEDVLNDDELDDEDKAMLEEADEEQIEDESLLSTSSNSVKAEESAIPAAKSEPEKKIVLKRALITVPETEPSSEATATPAKLGKLTQLTAQERIEMRQKKFGCSTVPVPLDVKKQSRAERFGIKSNDGENKPQNAKLDITTPVTVSVEVLKKRAERFGISVAPKLVTEENAEKILKRKERFGVSAPATGPTAATATTTDTLSEKAKMRLERFKIK